MIYTVIRIYGLVKCCFSALHVVIVYTLYIYVAPLA